MHARCRWLVGFICLLSLLIGQASAAHAQAAVCGGPPLVPRKSVAVCFRALLESARQADVEAASIFLSQASAGGKSDGTALFALIRKELSTAPVNDYVLRLLLRQHKPFYRALCQPAPEVIEIKQACADTAPWFAQGGACPSIDALLKRPDVRAGRCEPALSMDLAFSDSCRSAARAGQSPDVQRLTEILQTPFADLRPCRSMGLKVLCSLRPQAALPVLNHSEDVETDIPCLLALMDTQGESVEPAIRDFFFLRHRKHWLLIRLIEHTRPADRGRLASLLSELDPDAESYSWERAVDLLCTAPASAIAQSACQAEIGKRKEQLARRERWRTQHAPLASHIRMPYLRAAGITVLSVALAGLHVGLSIHYRDTPSNLGDFYGYQGALAGASLMTGIATAAALARGGNPGFMELAATVVLVPVAAVLAGVGGGIGGYRLGEAPGNGRIAVGVAAQTAILGTVLGFTWAFTP